MSHETDFRSPEIIDETADPLYKIFNGQKALPIGLSSDGCPRIRGYFLDEDADLGYNDAHRFEGVARVPDNEGTITYLAEKFLPNWPRTVWFKFEETDKKLYLKQVEGTEQPLDLWVLADDDDISYFMGLLFDLTDADPTDDYDSPTTSFMTHGKLYSFTTPQLQ